MEPTLGGEEKTRGGLESSALVGSIGARTEQVSIVKAKNSVSFWGCKSPATSGVVVIHTYTCTSHTQRSVGWPPVIKSHDL